MTHEDEQIINTITPPYMANVYQQKTSYEDRLPKVKLQRQNMEKYQLLLDRDELLGLTPKNAVFAEISVDNGDFNEKTLEIYAPQKLFLVDARHTDAITMDCLKVSPRVLRKSLSRMRLKLSEDYPSTWQAMFEDNSLDRTYIDTVHPYETTIRELYTYSPKIKPGGIITGHCYTMGNLVKWYRYGVIEAVRQFCVAFEWVFIFITADVTENPSFAIRKIP